MKKLVFRSALFVLLFSSWGLAGSSSAIAGSYEFQATCSGAVPSEPLIVSSKPGAIIPFDQQCSSIFGVHAGAWSGPMAVGDNGWVGYDLGSGAKFTEIDYLEYVNTSDHDISSGVRVEGGSVNYPFVSTTQNGSAEGTVQSLSIPAAAQGPRLKSRLICSNSPCSSNAAYALFRGTPRLTINDFTQPIATFGSSDTLIPGTWNSGTRSVEPAAVDGQSGVRLLWGLANNQVLYLKAAGCNALVGTMIRLQPCPTPYSPGPISINTTAAPWVEGQNSYQVCAMDFATIGTGNYSCTETRTIWIDN